MVFVPEWSEQMDDLLVEVVPDDHVKRTDRAAAVTRAAVSVLFGLK